MNPFDLHRSAGDELSLVSTLALRKVLGDAAPKTDDDAPEAESAFNPYDNS